MEKFPQIGAVRGFLEHRWVKNALLPVLLLLASAEYTSAQQPMRPGGELYQTMYQNLDHGYTTSHRGEEGGVEKAIMAWEKNPDLDFFSNYGITISDFPSEIQNLDDNVQTEMRYLVATTIMRRGMEPSREAIIQVYKEIKELLENTSLLQETVYANRATFVIAGEHYIDEGKDKQQAMGGEDMMEEIKAQNPTGVFLKRLEDIKDGEDINEFLGFTKQKGKITVHFDMHGLGSMLTTRSDQVDPNTEMLNYSEIAGAIIEYFKNNEFNQDLMPIFIFDNCKSDNIARFIMNHLQKYNEESEQGERVGQVIFIAGGEYNQDIPMQEIKRQNGKTVYSSGLEYVLDESVNSKKPVSVGDFVKLAFAVPKEDIKHASGNWGIYNFDPDEGITKFAEFMKHEDGTEGVGIDDLYYDKEMWG